jgi:hypothetical protein
MEQDIWESLWPKPDPVNNFITEQMIRDHAYRSIDRSQAKSSHSTGDDHGLPKPYFRTQIHHPLSISNVASNHARTCIEFSVPKPRHRRETDLFDCIAFLWIFSPQPDIKKENQMSTINLSTLVALAQPTHSDEFTQKAASIAPGKLGDKIQYLLQRKEDEKMDAAAETIVNLIKLSDDNITESVARIRAARQLIAAEKAKIEQIEMACAFGSETMNYIPLLKATAFSHMSQEAKVVDLAKIPEDFEKKYKDSKAKEAADASNKKVTAKKTPK